MKCTNRTLSVAFTWAVIALGHAGLATPLQDADWVFTGGRVETMDATNPTASAVAVKDGRIVFVGDEGGAQHWIGAESRIIDLEGKLLLPGFHDSHVHPVVGELESADCSLFELATQVEVERAIERWASDNPSAPWVRGGGWELTLFAEANPRREVLDKLVSDRPVALYSADGHSLWLNTLALKLAGIDEHTPDPPAGRIERDAKTGEASGVLREEAMGLIEGILPEHTTAEHLQAARRVMQRMNSLGITSAQDADVDEAILMAYAELEAAGELTTRIRASISIDPGDLHAEVERARYLREEYSGPRLRVEAVKLYADGVVEAHTAALLKPYSDGIGGNGPKTPTKRELARALAAFEKAGFQVHIHAIGDRAIRWTLDAIAGTPGHRTARHHLAHLQVIHPKDRKRFAKLGVVADFQPLWAYAHDYLTELNFGPLGEQRSAWIYPIASVLDTGATVCFGSDWTVSDMNPLLGLQVAITRADPDDASAPPFLPGERITLSGALRAYTLSGAYAAFDEENTGSIQVGKVADLILLDRDLFDLPPTEIADASVLLTLVEGEEVWRAEN